jgi:hypothetical protein
LIVEYVLSPKLQFQAVGVPVLMSIKVTFRGVIPEIGDAENAATGRFELRACLKIQPDLTIGIGLHI